MRIDWKNLKGGFAEFEKLAVEFVSEVETRNGCEWKQTKSTRDKNHDAILARENKDSSKPEFAVFVGYEYGVDIWWMEAKYSADSNEKKGMLSRYRLDATIVSAMLSRKISKIVFVTNLDIAPKTIIDIREALLRSNSCQEVRFYTKNHLENWILDKSPDFIESKFNYTSDMYTKIERPLFNVIEELSFYTLDSNYFQEPLNNIYTGIVYKVYFSVSVQNDSEAILDRCTNIEFLTDDVRKLQLKKGTNDFHFFARIPKDLHYESIQKTDVQGELKKILPPTIIYKMKCCASIDVHQLHIIPITSLKIINSTNVVFSLASQNRVVEELCTALLNHKNNAELTFSMISLFGRSGIGKSHVLQQFEARLLKKKYPIICNSYSFSGDMLTDIRLLQKIVFCLFFPYLFWEDLNQDYIQELRQLHPNIKSEFWDFVWLETEIEYFVSYSENPLLLASVLPEHVCINERIIILDDVQKMPAKCKQLLETMFIVLIQHKYPVFCIVTSQQKMDLEKYRIGKRQFLSSIELNLCVADICALFGNENMDFNDSLITTLFGSLIEVLYFKKYLSTLGKSIENVDDFKLAYLSFIHSELLKNEIVNKFTSVFRENKDAEALCSCIYYTASGIPQKLLCNVECTKKMLDLLMDAELIKRNDSDCYVYWHDYYREIFISHFQLTPYNGLQIPFKDTYDLKLQLALQNRDNIAIEHVLTQIQNLFDVQKYYSVYYILENVFLISSVKEWYKKHLSSKDYYLLFAYFAYANANVGTTYSGYELFNELYIESVSIFDDTVKEIRYIILWEIINSLYENDEYSEALKQIRCFQKMPENIKKSWKQLLGWDIASLTYAVDTVKMFIDSEKGLCCLYKLPKESAFFQKDVPFSTYRLLLCNLTNNYPMAETKLRQYNQNIQARTDCDPKTAYMYRFVVSFLDCIKNKTDINNVIAANSLLKENFVNDYNRHIFAIALLALSKDELQLCEQYGMEYMKTQRPMRKRQQAFKAAYSALVYFYKNQRENALDELKKEMSLLSDKTTYTSIIEHNITHIKTHEPSADNLEFYLGNSIQDGKYYIDIRMLY